MERRSNWRGCEEWRKLGLPFSTTSDEACKMYDAALTQYAGWYSDPVLGGLSHSIKKIIAADPSWVIGHLTGLALEMISTLRMPKQDSSFRGRLYQLVELSECHVISSLEKLHVKAVQLLADGYMHKACLVWEEILLDYPLDLLAIKFCFDIYIYLGLAAERRDMIAAVMGHWTSQMPLYGYLLGMYSFCLCEINIFDKAEQFGKKGLEYNKHDAWSTHSLAHIYKMTARYQDGINLMSSTVKDWVPCDQLACHNYWHWAVYNIEQGDYDGAIGIFDAEICGRVKSSHSGFNVSDAAALLHRLQMEGVNVGDRFEDIYEVCRPELDGRVGPFSESHYLLACLGSKHLDTAKQLIRDMRSFIEEGSETDCQRVKRDVLVPLSDGLLAYEEGNYNLAVDLIQPLRYQIHRIGGSDAQRDVFNLFLIQAAMKSTDSKHNKLARCWLAERKENLGNPSPLTERLIARSIALHGDS